MRIEIDQRLESFEALERGKKSRALHCETRETAVLNNRGIDKVVETVHHDCCWLQDHNHSDQEEDVHPRNVAAHNFVHHNKMDLERDAPQDEQATMLLAFVKIVQNTEVEAPNRRVVIGAPNIAKEMAANVVNIDRDKDVEVVVVETRVET